MVVGTTFFLLIFSICLLLIRFFDHKNDPEDDLPANSSQTAPPTIIAGPIQDPALLDDGTHNADGQEEVVADQPIPNIEPQNQIADQNVENLPEDGILGEESVVAEEESQEQETNVQGIIPVASNVLTDATPPQSLLIVTPVSPSLENKANGEDSGEGEESEEHNMPSQEEMDAVSENKSVVEKRDTADSVESDQDSGPLVKNAVEEEGPQKPSVNDPNVIPQLLDSDSNTAEPPRESQSIVPSGVEVQDNVVSDTVLVEEENQEPVSIQQESTMDSVMNTDSLTEESLSTDVPVSIPTPSAEQIPSTGESGYQKLETDLPTVPISPLVSDSISNTDPVPKPSNDQMQDTADCDSTIVEKSKKENMIEEKPISQDNAKSSTKVTTRNSAKRAIKVDASTMTDPLPEKSLPSQSEIVDQESKKREAEDQDPTVPLPEGSDSNVITPPTESSSSQPKESTEKQTGESEAVGQKPVVPKVVTDQDRLNVITTGKLGIFYTTVFLENKSFWGSKPDVLKKIDEFYMGKKRRALNEKEGRLAIDLIKARGQDDCPKTKALYCALSEFLCGGRGEQDFSLRILILLQERKGVLSVLRKMERTLFTELQDCADVFLKDYLNEYLQYHENRYVLKKPIEENPKFEWRSSLPDIQVPAEYPSFKECTLFKEGKERHMAYGNKAEQKPMYAAFYHFLTKLEFESKVLDLDFCLLETAVAANPEMKIIELEFKLFGGIFEHFENVDPNYTIKLLK